MSPVAIAEEYDLTQRQVEEALAFFNAHQAEIEALIARDALSPAAPQPPGQTDG